MENEIVKKSSGVAKALIITAAVFGLFLVFYSVMSVLSPGRKLDQLKAEFSPVTDPKDKINEEIFNDSSWLSLLKQKSFLQSRSLMAQNDSIYMTINLEDSISSIEISGVTVHSARISSFEVSRILRKCDDNILLAMLSEPFTIENSIATIRKEPVMIKVAPKDTSEYKPDIMPDTSLLEPVNYILELNGGTRIYIYQEEQDLSSDRKSQFRFDLTDRVRQFMSTLKSIVVLKVPEYHPFIKIRIPRDDAKIIYRALPKNGQIAVYT